MRWRNCRVTRLFAYASKDLHLAGSLILFLVILRYMSPAARGLKIALPVSMRTRLSAVPCIISGCDPAMHIGQNIIENASRNPMNPERLQVIVDWCADKKGGDRRNPGLLMDTVGGLLFGISG